MYRVPYKLMLMYHRFLSIYPASIPPDPAFAQLLFACHLLALRKIALFSVLAAGVRPLDHLLDLSAAGLISGSESVTNPKDLFVFVELN